MPALPPALALAAVGAKDNPARKAPHLRQRFTVNGAVLSYSPASRSNAAAKRNDKPAIAQRPASARPGTTPAAATVLGRKALGPAPAAIRNTPARQAPSAEARHRRAAELGVSHCRVTSRYKSGSCLAWVK